MEQNHKFVNQLAEVFPLEKLKWIVVSIYKQQNQQLMAVISPYLDSRELMSRFDNVLGGAWSCNYKTIERGDLLAIECTISVDIDGQVFSRSDIADVDTKASFANNSIMKSGYSNAFKRAAVSWGTGRYLYALDNYFVPISNNSNGAFKVNGKYKVGQETMYVKGSFNPPLFQVYNDLLKKGFAVNEPLQLQTNHVQQNTPVQQNTQNSLPPKNNEVNEILQLTSQFGGSANDLKEIIKKINIQETSLEEASQKTISQLRKLLLHVKSFFDRAYDSNIPINVAYEMLESATHKRVSHPLEVIFDIADPEIRNNLIERIQHYRKPA